MNHADDENNDDDDEEEEEDNDDDNDDDDDNNGLEIFLPSPTLKWPVRSRVQTTCNMCGTW